LAATVYSTEDHNYDFNQSGSNTHQATSNKDVQTSSTSTSTTTYTPSPFDAWVAKQPWYKAPKLMNLGAAYSAIADPSNVEMIKAGLDPLEQYIMTLSNLQ
jgi:hypothetical protein